MEKITDNKYYTESRPELLKYIPLDIKRMLDVGCSSANFSALVKSKIKDVEIWGIEMDALAAETAKTKIDKVLVGDLREIITTLPPNYFDCIAFNDILEHIYDPWEILLNIKKNISEEGVITASIPNVLDINNVFNLLFKKDWKYMEYGTLDKTHVRFFTKKSIIRMFEDCGYTVIKIEGINPNGKKAKLLSFLSFGFFNETQFLQFACVAKPNKK